MGNDGLSRVSAEGLSEAEEPASAAAGGDERHTGRLVGSVVAETYRILRRIGSGGTGQVYEAEHVRLGSKVAVKVLRAELGDRPLTLARFQREARILAAIDSDYVVRVLDCGELSTGVPYLTMELLRGEDLRSRLKRVGRITEERAIDIVLQACRGLASVHAAGVVHRDLKPANLFLCDRGEDGVRCKILDFGVAKALSAGDVTREGTAPGTLRYMAPEQVLRNAKPDARTDIYAIGAILYEMLVGAPPHDGETAEDLMFAIANQAPVPPNVVRPDVSNALSAAVVRCLARSPAARLQSVGELIDVLKALSSQHSLDTTLTERTLDHDRPGLRRPLVRRRKALAMGLVLGAVVGFGAWSALGTRATQSLGAIDRAVAVPKERNTTASAAAPSHGSNAPLASPVSSTPSAPSAAPRRRPPAPNTAGRRTEFDHLVDQNSPYRVSE